MKVESYSGSASGKGTAVVTKNLLTLGGSVSSSSVGNRRHGISTNLIKDGDFPNSNVISDHQTSWRLGQGTHWGNSVATANIVNGIATIKVTTIGAQSYQPQLVQYGLGLEKGLHYKLTFKAKASAKRRIEAAFQQSLTPWGQYASRKFNLTTEEQGFEFLFTMNSASDPSSQFAFNLGEATGSVSISDVKLVPAVSSPSAP
jgi:hypothetical protein